MSSEEVNSGFKMANALWTVFVEDCLSQDSALTEEALVKDFLTKPGKRPNVIIKKFFEFCSDAYRSYGNGSTIKGSIILNDTLEVKGMAGTAASWLCNMPDALGKECPSVVVHQRHIINNRALPDTLRIQNFLILHECGHLVKHWASLVTGGIRKRARYVLVANATPIEECFAWAFSISLLAIVASRYAFSAKGPLNTRHDDTFDNIW